MHHAQHISLCMNTQEQPQSGLAANDNTYRGEDLTPTLFTLSAQHVRLGMKASSKEEAIRLAGELLAENGCVEPEYIDAMQARENSLLPILANQLQSLMEQLKRKIKLRKQVSLFAVPCGCEIWRSRG